MEIGSVQPLDALDRIRGGRDGALVIPADHVETTACHQAL